MTPTLKSIAQTTIAVAIVAALAAPVEAAPAVTAASGQAPGGLAADQTDAYHRKQVELDADRIGTTEKVVAAAKAALDRASAEKSSTLVPLCERRLALLTERLGLWRQIAQFRLQKWEAGKRSDSKAQVEAQHKMDAAYQIMLGRQSEEREIRQKIEKSGKSK